MKNFRLFLVLLIAFLVAMASAAAGTSTKAWSGTYPAIPSDPCFDGRHSDWNSSKEVAVPLDSPYRKYLIGTATSAFTRGKTFYGTYTIQDRTCTDYFAIQEVATIKGVMHMLVRFKQKAVDNSGNELDPTWWHTDKNGNCTSYSLNLSTGKVIADLPVILGSAMPSEKIGKKGEDHLQDPIPADPTANPSMQVTPAAVSPDGTPQPNSFISKTKTFFEKHDHAKPDAMPLLSPPPSTGVAYAYADPGYPDSRLSRLFCLHI